MRKNKPVVKAVNRFVDTLNLSTPPTVTIPVDMSEGASKLDLLNLKHQDILKRVTYDLLPHLLAVIKLDSYKYDTPEVEVLLSESSKYHSLLNINKKLKTIQIVNDLLKLVGYTSKMVKQVREGENRYRLYRAIAYFGEALNDKIVNTRKLSQTCTQQAVDTVTPPPSIYIKSERGVTTLPTGSTLPTDSTLPTGLNEGGVTTTLATGSTIKIERGFEKYFTRVSYGNFEQVHIDLRIALRLLYEKIKNSVNVELLKLPTGENLTAYALHS
jgi:hypothetical protein